jgi:hypothetical protein
LIYYRHIGVSHNPTATKTSVITASKKLSRASITSKETVEQKERTRRRLTVEVNMEDDDQSSYISYRSITTSNGQTKKEMLLVGSNSHIPSGIGAVMGDNAKPKGRNNTLNNPK